MASAPDSLFDELVSILARRGTASFARPVVTLAMQRTGAGARLHPDYIERVIEDAMSSYRMFCKTDDDRRQLWCELIEYCEKHASTTRVEWLKPKS